MRIILLALVLLCSCKSHLDDEHPIQSYEYRIVSYMNDSIPTYNIYDACGNKIAEQIKATQLDSTITADNL